MKKEKVYLTKYGHLIVAVYAEGQGWELMRRINSWYDADTDSVASARVRELHCRDV